MSEEITKKIAEWAAKTGRPVAELQSDFDEQLKMFKANVPGKTDAWYADAAKRRLFLIIKDEITSPARPFDVTFLGYSSDMDVAAQEIQEKKALWQNPQTREQAIAEGKVYRFDATKEPTRMTIKVDNEVKEVPDGTPLDTREWMTPPDPSKNEKGRKNRNLGKPLAPQIIRNYAGLGKPATGGTMKLVALIMNGADRVKLLPPIPPKFSPVRVRMNVRSEDPVRYVCNSSTKTRFDTPITMPEIPDMKTLLLFLETAPPQIKVALAGLPAWHKDHEKDPRRIVIVEGDVSRINREPTPFGSLMMVLEDTSREDLEAEGTTVWIPGELDAAGQLDFGPGSRVFTLGRTTTGPGFNRETGQLDPSIERVMLNAIAIIVVPEFRVPPEEESVIGADVVK